MQSLNRSSDSKILHTQTFVNRAKDHGFNFYTGVPCSFLKPMINYLISDTSTSYIGATSEGEAIAIASGAWLAGKKSVVIFQNSGLGNTVNPLTSLNKPFKIPLLLVTTWRGQPGLKDQPQHDLMGEITGDLLSLIDVPNQIFPKTEEEVNLALEKADQMISNNENSLAFIMEKNTLAPEPLKSQPSLKIPRGQLSYKITGNSPPKRIEALETVLNIVSEDVAIIATTGKTGRELFTLNDRQQHFYLVGSMGGASALGLGVALNVKRPVLVIDGDGAALMKLGNFATIGAYAPDNLIHLLLDNGVHDSTGGQTTVSYNVDFPSIAIACGYKQATCIDSLTALEESLKTVFNTPGPHLIHLKIQPGSLENLGRPTVSPDQIARRFQAFLAS